MLLRGGRRDAVDDGAVVALDGDGDGVESEAGGEDEGALMAAP